MSSTENHKLSLTAWVLIISVAFLRLGYFASIPFLTLLLAERKDMELPMIGLIISIGPFAGVLTSFFSGYLSDRRGRYPLLLLSIGMGVFCFVALAWARDPGLLLVLNFFIGVAAYLGEPVIQAMLADLHRGPSLSKAFAYQYIAVNIGASIATLLGALFVAYGQTFSFLFTALIYFLVLIILLFWRIPVPYIASDALNDDLPNKGVFSMLREVFSNRRFCWLLYSFTIVGFTFTHITNTLALHLTIFFPKFQMSERSLSPLFVLKEIFTGQLSAGGVFSFLLFTNTVVVILVQKSVLKILKDVSHWKSGALGIVAISTGIICFSFAQSSMGILLVGVLLITLGEVVLFPSIGVLVGDIAPSSRRGAYFGAFAVTRLGGAVSGVVGSLLISKYSPGFTWLVIGIFGLLAVPLLKMSIKEKDLGTV